ncbi:MAG: hypothetical protein WBK20_03770 [Spirochaetota bacterium]
MKRIFIVIILLCGAFMVIFMGCKKKEFVQRGKRIDLPEVFLGINFCTLKAKDIIEAHQRAGAQYTIFDNDKNKEVTYDGNEEQLIADIKITSNYFIGKGIPGEMIMECSYSYIPIWDNFEITITVKEEYYNEWLNKCIKQFGYENAYINTDGYGEYMWSSGGQNDCIHWIYISKKSVGQFSPKVVPGGFFIVIRMTDRIKDHVH